MNFEDEFSPLFASGEGDFGEDNSGDKHHHFLAVASNICTPSGNGFRGDEPFMPQRMLNYVLPPMTSLPPYPHSNNPQAPPPAHVNPQHQQHLQHQMRHNLLLSPHGNGFSNLMNPTTNSMAVKSNVRSNIYGVPSNHGSDNNSSVPPLYSQASPSLSNYISDGESPDGTPYSSDVDDDDKKQKPKKRLKKVIEFDEAQKAQQDDYARTFPILFEKVKQDLLASKQPVTDKNAVDVMVNHFTNGAKGVHLSAECENYLQMATAQVEKERAESAMVKEKKSPGSKGKKINAKKGSGDCWECNHCDKKVKTREGIRLHIRNHHTFDKKWSCFAPNCNQSFVRQLDLRMHLVRVHCDERPFLCLIPYCGKKFSGISALRRHVKVDHPKIVASIITEVGVTNHLGGMSHQIL